jgi:hypothetical protein
MFICPLLVGSIAPSDLMCVIVWDICRSFFVSWQQHFLLFARLNKVSNTYLLSVELLNLAELLSFVGVQNLNTLHSLTVMHLVVLAV